MHAIIAKGAQRRHFWPAAGGSTADEMIHKPRLPFILYRIGIPEPTPEKRERFQKDSISTNSPSSPVIEAMPSRKGVTINVTAESDAGKRRHMEDYLDVQLSPNESLKKMPGLKEQAFIGVFDGHGGKEAALYARERLWDLIQEQNKFQTTDRQQVVEAIEESYWGLHKEMEPMRQTWKPNKLGDLSTAGTTACTVIFRQDHFYVANVGDSSVVLATVRDGQSNLKATMLSKDHKPEDPEESERVESLGGQVRVSRKGVPRVVWDRKKRSDDPDKPPTIDFIPFLSVTRSLGDFWSWNERTQQYVVSPQPDISIHPLDPAQQRFIVLASDGLWNVMNPQEVVDFIAEYDSEKKDVVRALIDEALRRWGNKRMFADNISIVIAFLSGCEEESDTSLVMKEEKQQTPSTLTVDHVDEREEEHREDEETGTNRSAVELKEEEEGVEVTGAKRRREEEVEVEEERRAELVCPPVKKSRQERDSGCESDSGSPVVETTGSLAELSTSSSSSVSSHIPIPIISCDQSSSVQQSLSGVPINK